MSREQLKSIDFSGSDPNHIRDFVMRHLLQPCSAEVGPRYLKEAERMLDELEKKENPTDQDKIDIEVLRDGIKVYNE